MFPLLISSIIKLNRVLKNALYGYLWICGKFVQEDRQQISISRNSRAGRRWLDFWLRPLYADQQPGHHAWHWSICIAWHIPRPGGHSNFKWSAHRLFHYLYREEDSMEDQGKKRSWWASFLARVKCRKNWQIKCILFIPRPIYRSTYWLIVDPNVSADISTDTQPICRLTYLPTFSQYIDWDILVDISTDISAAVSAKCRSTYCPTIRWYSGRDSADTLTIDCRWNIGQLSVVYR